MLCKQVCGAAATGPRVAGPISYVRTTGRQLQATEKTGSAKAAAAAQPELAGSWWVSDASEEKPAAAEGSVVEQKGAQTESGKVWSVHPHCIQRTCLR